MVCVSPYTTLGVSMLNTASSMQWKLGSFLHLLDLSCLLRLSLSIRNPRSQFQAGKKWYFI